jgi:hypothetical protein
VLPPFRVLLHRIAIDLSNEERKWANSSGKEKWKEKEGEKCFFYISNRAC